jgi:alpha-1,6-mannosyltransferase
VRWILARGVFGTVLMALAGLVYAPVPRPGWVARLAPLTQLRRQPWHLTAGLVVAFAGLVLLSWAWWSLRGRVRGRADGVRTVRRFTTVWSAPLLLAPPLFSGDGWSYVATGYLTGHGFSPYTVGPGVLSGPITSAVNHKWLHTPSPYGPLPLAWGGAWSQLTSNPWALLVTYRVLALIGLALVAWAVPVLARRCGRDPADASALVVASPFVIAQGIGGLHNDLLMAGLMLAALALTRPGVWWWGATAAGAAAAVKLPGGLAALGVVLLSLPPGATRGARVLRTGAVGLLSVGVLLASGLVTGLGIGWVRGLVVPAGEHTLLAPTIDVASHVALGLRDAGVGGHRLLVALEPMQLVRVLDLLVLGALALWILLVRRYADSRAVLAAVAVLLLGATLLSPVLHYWYFLWCVPLLACVPLPRWAFAALLTLLAVLGLTALADPALHVPWLAHDTARGLQVLPVLAAAGGWWWARRRGGGVPAAGPG